MKTDWSEPVKKATAFWGLGFPLAAVIAGGALAWAQLVNGQSNLDMQLKAQQETINARGVEIETIKGGLNNIKTDVEVTKSDVQWIRQEMERGK